MPLLLLELLAGSTQSVRGGSSGPLEELPPMLPAKTKGLVAREGIEPPTRGFSVRCSTN